MYTFADLYKDIQSGKVKQIPDVLKVTFINHMDRYGFGFQTDSESKTSVENSPLAERLNMIAGGLTVFHNNKKYIVCINQGLGDETMGITVWSTSDYSYVTGVIPTWNEICLGWLLKYPSGLVEDYTENPNYTSPEWTKFIKDMLTWFQWNRSPRVLKLQD